MPNPANPAGTATSAPPPCPQTTPANPPLNTSFRKLPPGSHRLIKSLAILLAGIAGMAALLSLLPAAGHDQLWFLLMARRWLAGATLYGPQIFDSNTPAVVWLSALPVALAHRLHLPIPFTAKLLTLLLLAAVALLAHRLLRHLVPRLNAAQNLFLAVVYTTLAAVLPARDLGQRDPLAALLCLPYLLAAALPLPSRRNVLPLRLLAGLLAALACCLKPQLSLIPLAIETTLLLSNLRHPRLDHPWPDRLRSLTRRPEPALLLLAGALFLAAIHRFAPLYFSVALPLLVSTYWAIGHLSPAQLLARAPELHLLAALTLTLLIVRPRKTLSPPPAPAEPTPHPATLLAVAALAATASYYLQGTGWYYQQLPALTLFAAALALYLLPGIPRLALRLDRTPRARHLPAATAALVTVALALTFHFSGYPFTLHPFTPAHTDPITTPDPSFFAALPPGTPVAILTTSVEDAIMPVFRFHLTWAQRTDNLWLLPALLRTSSPVLTDPPVAARHRLSPTRLAQLTTLQQQWMVEDLTRWQPALILVDRCQDPLVDCQVLAEDGLHRHDNLLAFFLADPAFARLWHTRYRYLRSAGPYDAFTRLPPP